MEDSKIAYESIFGSDHFSNLLRLTDGKLHTEDGYTFQVHKVILYKSSEYFQRLFRGVSGNRNEFWIPGISGEILSDILRYIYTENISLDNTKVADLMIASDYILLEDLYAIVIKYAQNNITLHNCLSLYVAAEKVRAKYVQRVVFRFIQMHFEEIVHNPSYGCTELPVEVLKQLLHCETLKISNERSVWLAVIMWIQKDVRRLPHILDLLMCLSPGDINEELAKDIMEHSIVANNPVCEKLQIQKTPSSSGYREKLLDFIQSRCVRPVNLYKCRIPQKMHLIYHFYDRDDEYTALYVSYDENLDYWRKIAEIDIELIRLFPFAHNIYMFDNTGPNGRILDLIDMKKINMDDHFQTENIFQQGTFNDAFKIEQCIYIITESQNRISRSETYNIKIYNILTNYWSYGASLSSIVKVRFTSISKKIYAVGLTPGMSNLIAMVYDSVSDMWLQLPSPRIQRQDAQIVALHERFFLIGGYTMDERCYLRYVEIFDPINNVWSELPQMPYEYNCAISTVVNDILIVCGTCYSDHDDYRCVRWNEAKICWEKLEKELCVSWFSYEFCSLDDAEVIRNLWKENRNPSTNFEKSPFSYDVFAEVIQLQK